MRHGSSDIHEILQAIVTHLSFLLFSVSSVPLW
jgi:hypothetical protein